ncbi:hypothetical protein LZ32DRAFT_664490 [Colletotrichum eremochloae]|nr:hypothetical protein LZ32DRAFT_664490 [Colletotrichum eremochloae]
MDSDPFFVNIGINKLTYTYALIDSGCLTTTTISKDYTKKLHAITAVTYAEIDLNGYKRNRLFFYIIPDQTDNVILGKT